MGEEFLEVLIFEVAGQCHAVHAREVQELVPALTIMPVPGTAPGIEGVMNLRGVIVPVLNVRNRLGLPAKPLALTDHFIVVRLTDRLIALHVDRALELARLPPAALTRVDSLGACGDDPAQVARLGDKMVLVHRIQDFIIEPTAYGGSTEVMPS
jgi:purine-binding chemotaxis protein CheW